MEWHSRYTNNYQKWLQINKTCLQQFYPKQFISPENIKITLKGIPLHCIREKNVTNKKCTPSKHVPVDLLFELQIVNLNLVEIQL